jgi:hypothetical protein
MFSPPVERHDDTVRVDLTNVARRGMSPRQAVDMHVAMLLLRSATLPDSFFADHPAKDADGWTGLWDRVAIVAALDDVAGLPEIT